MRHPPHPLSAAIRGRCLKVPAWAGDTDIQRSLGEEERAVSASKKAKDKAQAAKGKVKKGAGKALGEIVASAAAHHVAAVMSWARYSTAGSTGSCLSSRKNGTHCGCCL